MKYSKITIFCSTLILFINLSIVLSAFAGWTEVPTGQNISTANDVWGSSSNDIFVVGRSGVLHFNGSEWNEMDTNTNSSWFKGVWGSSGSDVYAVGLSGMIANYNGNTWSTIPTDNIFSFNDVWGSSDDNVFVVGNQGVIYHYDGIEWEKMTSNVDLDIYGVWGSSGSDVYAVGDGFIIHYDGTVWEEILDPYARLLAVWGTSENNIYAVSQTSLIYHFDGNQWSELWSEYRRANTNLWGVWGTKDGMWFVGEEGIGDYPNAYFLYYDASNDSWHELINSTYSGINGIWGTSVSDVFAVGGHHLDGGSTLVIRFNGVFDDDYTQIDTSEETNNVVNTTDDSNEDDGRVDATCFISILNSK